MARPWVTNVCLLLSLSAGVARAEDMAKEPAKPEAAKAEAQKVDDKLAYAAGLLFGQRVADGLADESRTADLELILQGVRDGFQGLPSKYPQDELEAAMATVERAAGERRAEARLKVDPEFKAEADANAKSSKEALELNAALDGVESLPSGIQVQVLKEGTGPFVAEAKKIKANFKVHLMNGVLVKSSPDGKPAEVKLDLLAPKLHAALREMKVGSTWRLAVPAEHAFGLAGKPPLIGPNQAVLIEAELVGVE